MWRKPETSATVCERTLRCGCCNHGYCGHCGPSKGSPCCHQVCKQRLQLVHTIPELFDIAVRVLKEADFKEKFLQLASEELDSIPALEQECFLKATHESPSFERDILVQESVIFEHLLCRQEQPAPIDCDPEENFERKRKFSVPLKPAPSSGSALDLDSE